MATHSSSIAWEIPWTEESDGLQTMGSQESDMTLWLNNNKWNNRECKRREIKTAPQHQSGLVQAGLLARLVSVLSGHPALSPKSLLLLLGQHKFPGPYITDNLLSNDPGQDLVLWIDLMRLFRVQRKVSSGYQDITTTDFFCFTISHFSLDGKQCWGSAASPRLTCCVQQGLENENQKHLKEHSSWTLGQCLGTLPEWLGILERCFDANGYPSSFCIYPMGLSAGYLFVIPLQPVVTIILLLYTLNIENVPASRWG